MFLTFRIIVELEVGNCKKLIVIHNYDNTITNLINRSVNIWNSLNNDIIKYIYICFIF